MRRIRVTKGVGLVVSVMLMLGIVVLVGCDRIEENELSTTVGNTSTAVNVDATNSMINQEETRSGMNDENEGEENENATDHGEANDLNLGGNASGERISGSVQMIEDMQFEIMLLVEQEIEGSETDVIVGFDDPDAPPTVVIVDENTVFEIVRSDGMIILDRWEGSFADLVIGRSVYVFGEYVGDQFLAREVIIWSWTFM